MKIIKLTAENVKRLKAVEITPAGTLQVIGGRNGQGKTSVLDAIWLALGGGAAAKSTVKPIRDGENHASVRLDLGDLVVTRTWTGDKTALTVTAADGAKYNSPQSVLDALIGRLSFDPIEFTQFTPTKQREALLTLVDLPFDPGALDAERTGVFGSRTEIGRTVRGLEGQLAGLPAVPADTPDVEVSSGDLFTELRAAQDAHAQHALVLRVAEEAQSAREHAEKALAEAQFELEAAQGAESRALSAVHALPDLPDTLEIGDRIATVDQVNAAVRTKTEWARVVAELKAARMTYDAGTDELARIDLVKADGLAAAQFPIDGLGFDDDGVTYQGLPFSQASSAEQIRVSLAIAIALNPKLRVIRILDGSLLDADNMALIEAMASASDYQVWMERVGDSDENAVIIEDGQAV